MEDAGTKLCTVSNRLNRSEIDAAAAADADDSNDGGNEVDEKKLLWKDETHSEVVW